MNTQGKGMGFSTVGGSSPIMGTIANMANWGSRVQQAEASATVLAGQAVSVTIGATQQTGTGIAGLSDTDYKVAPAADATAANLSGIATIGGDFVANGKGGSYENGALVPYVTFGSGVEVWLKTTEDFSTQKGGKYDIAVTTGALTVAKTQNLTGAFVTVIGGPVNGYELTADGKTACKLVRCII